MKGLFARLKLTKWGKELVSGREYRYVSPTFGLDENGKPVELYSIAATNTPAFAGAMSPILNQAPSESAGGEEQHVSTEEQEISPMEIEKLKEELLEALHEEVASLADAAKEAKEEPAEQAVNEGDAPLVDKEAKPEAAEESKEDADAGVQVVEASSEEPAGQAEAPVQEEEKAEEREVIKIEALNSAPAPTLAPQPEAWRSMTPEQFCKWVEAGMPK